MPAFTGGNALYESFRKTAQINEPGRIFVILDERSDSINDGYFGVDMSNTGTRAPPEGFGADEPGSVGRAPGGWERQRGCARLAGEGIAPKILGRATLPIQTLFNSPQTFVSEFGDTWRLFGKQLKDGSTLVLGLNGPSDLSDPDSKLVTNAEKFGTTLQEAVAVNSKRIDWAVDYVVLNPTGEIVVGWGGVPLRTDPGFLAQFLAKQEVLLDGKPTLLASRIVYNSTHKPLATVVVPRAVAAEHIALRSQWRFNAAVAGLAWLVVVTIMLSYFVAGEVHRQRPSLTEARRQGEDQYIEFKRSLLWDRERGYEDEKLRWKVLKVIVGFLNTGGGILFIGVQDDGKPWGLEDDLKRCDGSEDKLHQKLRNCISNAIGGEFARYIMTGIDNDPDYSGYRIFRVAVDGARHAAFLKSGGHSFFYVRSGPETQELDMQKAYRYILEARLKI